MIDPSRPAGPVWAEGQSRRQGRPVVVGEVLFDVFPDGSRVLGGAPFNVAWNLQAFGLAPLMVTRVGSDEPGQRVLAAMRSWGMDSAGVQRDPEAPTGEVRVELEGGEPTFEILPDRAYDNLETEPALAAVSAVEASLLYHGSLIARGDRARRTVAAVRETSGLPAFLDVNLRDPWREEVVTELVAGARWVKLNQDELGCLSGLPAADVERDAEAVARAFARRFELAEVVVTRGSRGALVVSGDEVSRGSPPEWGEVVDTVGAGDAFASVWLVGRVRGWPPELVLRRALDFAADVCRIRGATTDDATLYRRHLDAWQA